MNIHQVKRTTFDDLPSLLTNYERFKSVRPTLYDIVGMSKSDRNAYMKYLIQYDNLLTRSDESILKHRRYIPVNDHGWAKHQLLDIRHDFNNHLTLAKQINKGSYSYSKPHYRLHWLLRWLRIRKQPTLQYK